MTLVMRGSRKMSLVVAIRNEDGNFILAGDSQVTCGDKISHDDEKVYKFKNGIVLGSVGTCRVGNILQYSEEIFEPLIKDGAIDKQYLYTDFTVELYERLKKYYNHVGEIDKEYTNGIMGNSEIIIAYKNEAYDIYCDYCIVEIKDYKAIGSGEPTAVGAIEALKSKTNLSPYEIITEAFKICSNSVVGIDNNVKILHS